MCIFILFISCSHLRSLSRFSPAGRNLSLSFSPLYVTSLPYFPEFDFLPPSPICSVFPDPVSFHVVRRFSIAYLFRLIIRFLSRPDAIATVGSSQPCLDLACSFESRVKNVTRTISYQPHIFRSVFRVPVARIPSLMTQLTRPHLQAELCLLRYAAYVT